MNIEQKELDRDVVASDNDYKNPGSVFKQIKESVFFHSRHNVLLEKLMKWIDKVEQFDEEEIQFLKKKKITSTVQLALKRSSFYQQLYPHIDFRKPFTEWFDELPVINKSQIRMHSQDIALMPVSVLKAAQTSGTSGSPLTVYRSAPSILRENAYNWRFKMSHGLHIGDPVVSLRAKLDKHTMYSFNSSENVLYLSSYLLSEKNIKVYGYLIEKFKPKAILAYPSSVFTLVTLLEKAGMASHIPLIFTSSETLYDFQREKIEKVLGGRVYDYYGNAERTIAYGECANGHYHEMPMYSYNEFTGSRVVTTSLINPAFPLIKYVVDDGFITEDGTCECGKPLQVKKIEGRTDDVIRSPDGTMVTGLSLSFRGINGLKYAQVIQKELSSVQVNIVTENSFSASDEKLLMSQLKDRLSDSLQIHIQPIEEEQIMKSPSGKFKLVISNL